MYICVATRVEATWNYNIHDIKCYRLVDISGSWVLFVCLTWTPFNFYLAYTRQELVFSYTYLPLPDTSRRALVSEIVRICLYKQVLLLVFCRPVESR